MSEQVSIMESVNNSPVLALVGITFVLVRSRVNHLQIQEYVNKGYISPDSFGHPWFRPPGDEIVPQPRPYEADSVRRSEKRGRFHPYFPMAN